MNTTTNKTATETTFRAFAILGTTDDVTTCDLCGREDLKSTVALQPLTDGAPDGEPVYFGCDCAARAMGWTQKEVRSGANAADRAKEEAARKREWAIDCYVGNDPAVIAANRARSARLDQPGAFSVPFAVRRLWPEHIAWIEAEKNARARAEALF